MSDVAVLDRPFALPLESVEIILDLPMPTSVNRIWRACRGRVFKSKEYFAWQKEAYYTAYSQNQRKKIDGPFEIHIYLARAFSGDGDNRIKGILDFLQTFKIIRNDSDCRKGQWEWVPTAEAPLGCRVHIRSLHGD